jgi:hypothetical protein
MWINAVIGLRVGHVYSQSKNVTGERSVPLPLGLAAYCTLVDSFGGLKVAAYFTLANSFDGSKMRGG